MKFPVVSLLLLLIVAALGCDDGNGMSVVFDGPIMETVTETGELEYNGAVVNLANQPVSSVFVDIVLKDKDGQVIDIQSVSATNEFDSGTLMPGERAFFMLVFDTDPDTVVTKEAEIYYNEFL